MADMDMAVGVRRPVVKHVGRFAGCCSGHFPVKVVFFPSLENFQLFLGKIRLHGKIGNRQIECSL